MAQVYLQKGGRIRLVESSRVEYWEKQGFKKLPKPKKETKKEAK